MEQTFIHESARITNSQLGVVKLYRNVVINDSTLADGCSIGDDTTIDCCVFEGNAAINRRSYIYNSFIGRYTYTGINTFMTTTQIGRFCSLSRNVDIGGKNHDYHKVTTMPGFQFRKLSGGEKKSRIFGRNIA